MEDINRYTIPNVESFMKRNVITFTPKMDLSHVLKEFNKHHISSAPVVKKNKSREVVGIITENDLIRIMADSSFFYGPSEPLLVEEAMTQKVQMLSPLMDLFEAIQYFRKNNLRHAPVLDEKNNLLGMVARRDILIELEKLNEDQEAHIQVIKNPKKRSMINEALWRTQ